MTETLFRSIRIKVNQLNMKTIKLLFLLALMSIPAWGMDIRSGEDLVTAMHNKYDGKWSTVRIVTCPTNGNRKKSRRNRSLAIWRIWR
jgi:hypothetical protein